MVSARTVTQYRIKTNIPRPESELFKNFYYYPTATISDAMESRNTLTHSITPVWGPPHRLVGPAITVNVSVGDDLLALKAIEIAEPGDVIVVAGNAEPYTALWGGIMSTMATARGVNGLVTDGMIRDLNQCKELSFPIWAKGVTPLKPKTDVPPGDLNLPITIGEAIVNPGDLVVADEDGVVIVPKNLIKETEEAVQIILKKEEERVKKINSTKQMISKSKIDNLLAKRSVTYLDDE